MPPTSTSTEKKERAVLRTDAASASSEEIKQGEIILPAKATAPLPARDRLWGEGLRTVADLTGKPPPQCRALVGRWLKRTGDDCARLLAILHDAEEHRPIDPIPWIEQALATRLLRKSNAERIADELGLNDPDPVSSLEKWESASVVAFPTERRLFA